MHPTPASIIPARIDLRRRTLVAWSPCAMLMPLVAGCSTTSEENTPPRKEQAQLFITISADADANSDIKGRGAPVLLRIYELKSAVAFEEADFFALQDQDKSVLGADLLASDQFLLRPGENKFIRRKTHASTTAIGVFAAFRDKPNAVWRAVHRLAPAPEAHWYRAVVPARKIRLAVAAQARAVEIFDLAADGDAPADAPPQQRNHEPSRPAMPEVPDLSAVPSIPSAPGLPTMPPRMR